jgi:Chemotaxis protein histidine kinase and related kinases
MMEERQRSVESFIDTSLEMLHWLHPFVRALVAQPDREDILPNIIDSGFRLLYFVNSTGATLGFNHLTAPIEGMEYLLDRVRSGILPLTLPRIVLLAEVCSYLEHGLAQVRAEQSDTNLAETAAKLASAIRADAFPEHSVVVGGRADGVPEDARDAFFWETTKLVDTAEQECAQWDSISIDSGRVTELSRVLNRLKQCFALYDFRDPERICQAMTSTLNRFVQGECFQTEYPERIFLRCIDALRAALAVFPSSNELVIPGVEQLLAILQGLMRQPIGELLIEAGLVDSVAIDQALEIQRSAPEGQSCLLGEVLVSMGRVTTEQIGAALREQRDKRELVRQPEVVHDTRGRAMPDAPLAVTIDGNRLERMSLLLDRLMALRPPDNYLAHLGELREIVRNCRLDAFASLTSRLHRMVHDLAAESGKRVYFTVEGIETLPESGEATALAASLCHLLRNSVEHGLEGAEERRSAGKKTTGRLHLLALRQDEEIWIIVEDDGRGCDDERMKNILVEHRQEVAGAVDGLSNRECMSLPMESLGSSVLSDNGVQGLVAVRKTLQDIGGRMHVTTCPGKGTCVTLRVPRRGDSLRGA